VDSHPKKYFPSINYAKPVEYEIVKLDSYIFAKDIAKSLGVKKSQLEQHNRSLRETIWNDTKRIPKNYLLRVPKSLLNKPVRTLLAGIPLKNRYQEQTPDLFHHVVRGDTISDIAEIYGFRVRDIMMVNGMSSGHFIRVGQKLRLPVKDKSGATIVAVKESQPASLTQAKPEIVVLADQQKQTTSAIIQNEDSELTTEQPSLALGSTDNAQEELDVSVVAEADIDVVEEVSLLSDPADYTVDDDMTIEVQASETLGHYADWLDLRASRLREINKLKFGKPVVVGNRLLLDFSAISIKDFENRRIAYQKNLQEEFFTQYRIESTYQHVISAGESLWVLALRKFKVPIWLLRQHNPDVNFNRIQPAAVIVVPKLIEVGRSLNSAKKAN